MKRRTRTSIDQIAGRGRRTPPRMAVRTAGTAPPVGACWEATSSLNRFPAGSSYESAPLRPITPSRSRGGRANPLGEPQGTTAHRDGSPYRSELLGAAGFGDPALHLRLGLPLHLTNLLHPQPLGRGAMFHPLFNYTSA